MRIINTHSEEVPPERVLTESEILALCCEVVPVDECSEVGRVGVYEGADEGNRNFNEDDALAKARADHPNYMILGVKTEGIGPPPGLPCGKLYESWQGRNNCCDGVPALVWDMGITPDVLPHSSSIVIAWNGSDSRQVELSTSSNGTWFDGGRKTVVGYGDSIQLFAGETFCGNTAVTVNDGCSVATVIIRSDLGEWISLGAQCIISGGTDSVVNGWGERIDGRYKQREHVELVNWSACLFCAADCTEDVLPTCLAPLTGSGCTGAYLSRMEAIRPAPASMDTCLDFAMNELISGNVIYGYLGDGAIVYRSGAFCAYDCHCYTYYTGSTAITLASVAQSLSVEAYEWRC